MRSLLFMLAAVLASPSPSPSLAQTQAERDYLAERDRALALAKPPATYMDVHKRWMPVLEARLRRLIGPGVPKGFDGKSAMTPDGLCCKSIGMLDGIRFTTPDDTGAVLVTTEGLLQEWLKVNDRGWWQPSWRTRSTDPARAFLTGGPFSGSGVWLDTASFIHAVLPITSPPTGSAAAALVQETQDPSGYHPPQYIAVMLFKGGLAYLAQVKATAAVVPIAACGAIYAEAKKQSFAARSDDDKSRRLQVEGEAAFEKCWTERAKDQPNYAALMRQAQALANTLAAP